MATSRNLCSNCLHYNASLKRCAQVKPSDKLQEYVLIGTVSRCFMYESEDGRVSLTEDNRRD
jgi:hypothetical protein